MVGIPQPKHDIGMVPLGGDGLQAMHVKTAAQGNFVFQDVIAVGLNGKWFGLSPDEAVNLVFEINNAIAATAAEDLVFR